MNKNVVVHKDNSEVSVPTNRVIPETIDIDIENTTPTSSSNVVETTVDLQEDNSPDASSKVSNKPTDIRPRKGRVVEFKVNNEDNKQEGKVVDVGKLSGKNKNRCWIRTKNGTVDYDLCMDVESWKYKNITFDKNIKENSNDNDDHTSEK